MTVKHQPATPLPFNAVVIKGDQCLQDEQGNDLIGRIDLADYDRPDVEVQNIEYLGHAANAYPKLVEALQSMLALQRAVAPTAQGRSGILGNTTALLRDLGEAE